MTIIQKIKQANAICRMKSVKKNKAMLACLKSSRELEKAKSNLVLKQDEINFLQSNDDASKQKKVIIDPIRVIEKNRYISNQYQLLENLTVIYNEKIKISKEDKNSLINADIQVKLFEKFMNNLDTEKKLESAKKDSI